MPKDQRLYMTFPNDFWMHPKVALLSVEAKWTFVEMNGYSRMQDLDGVIPVPMAERLWATAALTELVGSHPERPLIIRDGDTFVIRDYAKHQQTQSDREELSRKRSEAGSKGRAKQLSDKSGASAGQVSGQIWAETETETETETKELKSVVPRKRVTNTSDDLFETFWAIWPKRVAKGDAERAWKKAIKKTSPEHIIEVANGYAQSPYIPERQFIPLPATWLNGERWADDLPQPSLVVTKARQNLSTVAYFENVERLALES